MPGDELADSGVLARVQALAAGGAAFIYGDSLEQVDSGLPRYKRAKTPESLPWGLFTHHQAMFYERKALADLRYDLRYRIAADYDLTARFLARPDVNISRAEFPVCIFEGGGLSQTQARLGRDEQFAVRRNLGMVRGFKNRLIYWAQGVVWGFRQKLPALYWHLKSSGNSGRVDGQIQNRGDHQ